MAKVKKVLKAISKLNFSQDRTLHSYQGEGGKGGERVVTERTDQGRISRPGGKEQLNKHRVVSLCFRDRKGVVHGG